MKAVRVNALEKRIRHQNDKILVTKNITQYSQADHFTGTVECLQKQPDN